MAITRSQQAKQMLQDGGRIGFKGGADMGTVRDSRGRRSATTVNISPTGSVTTSAPRGQTPGPDDRSTPTQTANQLRNQNRFVAEDFDLFPEDTPIRNVDVDLTPREEIFDENKNLFITAPANYPKFIPSYVKAALEFNRQPNRRFFFERVLKNNAAGLNYTELEKAYDEYLEGRMSGETDAMGNPIPETLRGNRDEPILFPQGQGIMSQASGTTDQGTDDEDEDLRRLAFRADGGPIGGIMDLESGRQMYFLGKLVKKATRAVKKIAKSPIGKLALLYTGAGALGNLAGGSGLAGMFRGFRSPSTFLGNVPKIFSKEGLGNILVGGKGPSLGGNRGMGRGIIPEFSGLFGKGGKLNPFTAFSAVSALAGVLTPEQEDQAQQLADNTGVDIEEARNAILQAAKENYAMDVRARGFKADGGLMRLGYQEGSKEPVAKKTMPLLDMGGKEMDLREDGGFVPIGRMEKADDVPARLSKNEFVFTADAVRNAGDGDVDKGAEVMYNMMKNLESGGDVSEESQGLEGARRMFQTSQRLEEVL